MSKSAQVINLDKDFRVLLLFWIWKQWQVIVIQKMIPSESSSLL